MQMTVDHTTGLQGYKYGTENQKKLLYPTATIIIGNNSLTENCPT